MPSWSLDQERLWLVIDQQREELEESLGDRWQSEVARRLDVHQSTVNKIWNRTRTPGREVINAAREQLKIDPSFFTNAKLGTTPSFRKHVQGTHVERDDERGPQALEDVIAVDRPDVAVADRARRAARSIGVYDHTSARLLLSMATKGIEHEVAAAHPDAVGIDESSGQKKRDRKPSQPGQSQTPTFGGSTIGASFSLSRPDTGSHVCEPAQSGSGSSRWQKSRQTREPLTVSRRHCKPRSHALAVATVHSSPAVMVPVTSSQAAEPSGARRHPSQRSGHASGSVRPGVAGSQLGVVRASLGASSGAGASGGAASSPPSIGAETSAGSAASSLPPSSSGATSAPGASTGAGADGQPESSRARTIARRIAGRLPRKGRRLRECEPAHAV